MAEVEIIGDLAALASLDEQITFASAAALTGAAKRGQSASIRAIRSTFTTRGQWFQPDNRFGIKVKPASKGDLESQVYTAADWLEKHETGGVKRPRGRFLAVPTATARPNPRAVIPRANRPANLRRAFVAETRRGPVLFERRPGGNIRALYGLEKSARIRKRSTVVGPVEQAVTSGFGPIFDEALEGALKTAR